MERCRHGLLIGEPLLFLGSEAVQQEDGVVQLLLQLFDRGTQGRLCHI